jgi:hypothetical protein
MYQAVTRLRHRRLGHVGDAHPVRRFSLAIATEMDRDRPLLLWAVGAMASSAASICLCSAAIATLTARANPLPAGRLGSPVMAHSLKNSAGPRAKEWSAYSLLCSRGAKEQSP